MKAIKTEEDYFTEKYPDRAKRARTGSRKEAILVHCTICSGSAQEARKCPSKDCFLWNYRPGAK